MRVSEGAVAVIRSSCNGGDRWLAQWNEKWQAYNLVAGHRQPGETFRECLVREIAEELGLSEETDYQVSGKPPTHLEFVEFSQSAHCETRYIMELFDVRLHAEAHLRVDLEVANQWLSGPEIEAGRTGGGEAVSATVKRLLSEFAREA